jgi:antibiotic biosynthesis monooxygenase (ABM) superfamily enzyme
VCRRQSRAPVDRGGRTERSPLRPARRREAQRGTHFGVITRLWRGWTAPENANAYQRFLLEDLFPSMSDIPGFRGADVLRRDEPGEVAFVTLTRFDTLDAIRAFAGNDYETAVLEPTARALLSRYEDRAQHFDTSSFAA